MPSHHEGCLLHPYDWPGWLIAAVLCIPLKPTAGKRCIFLLQLLTAQSSQCCPAMSRKLLNCLRPQADAEDTSTHYDSAQESDSNVNPSGVSSVGSVRTVSGVSSAVPHTPTRGRLRSYSSMTSDRSHLRTPGTPLTPLDRYGYFAVASRTAHVLKGRQGISAWLAGSCLWQSVRMA